MDVMTSRDGATRPSPPAAGSVGIGLRYPHHRHVLENSPQVDWFEVHAENYLGEGLAAETLDLIRERYAISLHATACSLGSADGIDERHLARLRHMIDRIDPFLVSDHLSWGSVGEMSLPDLLPLPYTREALRIVARNVEIAQQLLDRPILLENPSTYFELIDMEMSEGEFLGELSRRTGCGILLDMNNVAVTAHNLRRDPLDDLDHLLAQIPASAIRELHIAGHTSMEADDGSVLQIDDHGSPPDAQTWGLLTAALRRLGPRPVLIEWDTNIPAFDILEREAGRARRILEHEARGRCRL